MLAQLAPKASHHFNKPDAHSEEVNKEKLKLLTHPPEPEPQA